MVVANHKLLWRISTVRAYEIADRRPPRGRRRAAKDPTILISNTEVAIDSILFNYFGKNSIAGAMIGVLHLRKLR